MTYEEVSYMISRVHDTAKRAEEIIFQDLRDRGHVEMPPESIQTLIRTICRGLTEAILDETANLIDRLKQAEPEPATAEVSTKPPMRVTLTCAYCKEPKANTAEWRNCPCRKAQEARAKDEFGKPAEVPPSQAEEEPLHLVGAHEKAVETLCFDSMRQQIGQQAKELEAKQETIQRQAQVIDDLQKACLDWETRYLNTVKAIKQPIIASLQSALSTGNLMLAGHFADLLLQQFKAETQRQAIDPNYKPSLDNLTVEEKLKDVAIKAHAEGHRLSKAYLDWAKREDEQAIRRFAL